MHRQIYHISLLTAFAVAALLSSACSADGNGELQPTATDQQPVAFTATMADGQGATTRAVPNVIDITALRTGGFGVFACYTGLHHYGDTDAQPDFMYNQQITWNSGTSKWTYSPLKYWPNGEGVVNGSTGTLPHHVSFMAYAPYSDMSTGDVGYCIPSMSYQHEVGNPWITYRLHTDPMHQVDLLYATPLLDQTKQSTAASLSFAFQHALACVGNEITVTPADAMKTHLNALRAGEVERVELVLQSFSITYTLTEKGRLAMWSSDGKPHWETINSESGLVTRTINYTVPANTVLYNYNGTATTTDYTNDEHGIFYIPAHLANHYQKAVATLSYQVRTYNSADALLNTEAHPDKVSAPIVLSDYDDAYKPGKNLTMTFRIKND